ncbi:MAG: DUF2911 domain-containing protein [Bacteroidota bacterium]
MRYSILFFIALCISVSSFCQLQVTEPDKSPLDVSYSPQGYPILKFQNKQLDAKPNARVIYSRPQVKGRTIFGSEVKYNEVWRLGANESTEIEFFRNAVIGGKKVPKGRYSLFCVPDQNKWTFILNKDTDSWGGFSYNESMDVLRTAVPVIKTDSPVEYLTIYFDNPNNLVIMWADAKANLPIQFSSK